MATRQQGTATTLGPAFTGIMAPQTGNIGGAENPNVQGIPNIDTGFDENTNDGNVANGSKLQTDEGEQLPADWIARSSLIPDFPAPDAIVDDSEPACFFEPLNYCKPGRLMNGFCEYHASYMFNVTLATCGTLMRTNTDKIVHIKQLRKFIRFPTRFQASLLRIMPIPELCQNIEEFEQNLRLDLFAYLLSPRYNDQKFTDLEVAVHKAYIVRALRLFTPSPNAQHRPDDSVIVYNISNWLRYCSRELARIRYDGKLVFLASNVENGTSEIRYLSLNRCSVFTQMISLLYDTPYVQSPSLNYKWLSVPAAVNVYDSLSFVLDCTKASHGTATNLGVSTLGDPATLSYFRLDKNDNIYIIEDKYTPAREICFRSEVNKGELIGVNNNIQAITQGPRNQASQFGGVNGGNGGGGNIAGTSGIGNTGGMGSVERMDVAI